MKLKEAIKKAKSITTDLYIGRDLSTVKLTKKEALQACKNYLNTDGLLGFEWRNETDDIIARFEGKNKDSLSIGR